MRPRAKVRQALDVAVAQAAHGMRVAIQKVVQPQRLPALARSAWSSGRGVELAGAGPAGRDAKHAQRTWDAADEPDETMPKLEWLGAVSSPSLRSSLDLDDEAYDPGQPPGMVVLEDTGSLEESRGMPVLSRPISLPAPVFHLNEPPASVLAQMHS